LNARTIATRVEVYLECGAKRTFAAALDWPGWCRQGPDEVAALASLVAYGPRYASVLARTRLGFVAPRDLGQLVVVERLPGNATTDFGAPGAVPTADHDRSCDAPDRKRLEQILAAAWRAFDETVKSARGKTLATGPRGGGRSLEAIVSHVVGADAGYLTAVGWRAPKTTRLSEQLTATREAILAALRASAAGEIPARGPRGGARVAGAVLRAACGLACAGPRMGDRATRRAFGHTMSDHAL
jgi:hypothetical protein